MEEYIIELNDDENKVINICKGLLQLIILTTLKNKWMEYMLSRISVSLLLYL